MRSYSPCLLVASANKQCSLIKEAPLRLYDPYRHYCSPYQVFRIRITFQIISFKDFLLMHFNINAVTPCCYRHLNLN